MMAKGGAHAVHHIESPAMVGLCRRCDVRNIDGLMAIVSGFVRAPPTKIRRSALPGVIKAWSRGLSAPSLAPCLKSTLDVVVGEEHILQICEAFAGCLGRADILRRALAKQKQAVIEEVKGEFVV